jgi:hypothetical protein
VAFFGVLSEESDGAAALAERPVCSGNRESEDRKDPGEMFECDEFHGSSGLGDFAKKSVSQEESECEGCDSCIEDVGVEVALVNESWVLPGGGFESINGVHDSDLLKVTSVETNGGTHAGKGPEEEGVVAADADGVDDNILFFCSLGGGDRSENFVIYGVVTISDEDHGATGFRVVFQGVDAGADSSCNVGPSFAHIEKGVLELIDEADEVIVIGGGGHGGVSGRFDHGRRLGGLSSGPSGWLHEQ